ncbi:MAG: hypothetical protein GY765_20660, partial [bacterium]|nr:hypothetical protein [bacterium]
VVEGPSAESNNVFSIITQRTLTLTSPNGSESWEAGTTKDIIWNSTGDIANVKIEYSTDSGSTWLSVINSVTNTSPYNWTVPDTVSSNCKIKISDVVEGPSAESNSVFSIATQRTLTLTAPNGGESWEAGTEKSITWNSTGSIANVKIDYSTDNGATWNEIIASTDNDSLFAWELPNTASTQCLIKISETDGPSDTSDAVFSIITGRTITITAPKGGEEWNLGSTGSITWNVTGSIADVSIAISRDGGTNWTTIVESTPNTGAYNWTISGPNSENCLIRVKDTDTESAASDTSAGVFSIPVPLLQLTTPNGGETYKIGETVSVYWSAPGVTEPLKLVLLQNETPVADIATELAPDGRFSWTAGSTTGTTAATGEHYKIRIQTMDESLSYDCGNFTLTAAEELTIKVNSPSEGQWMQDTNILISGEFSTSTVESVSITVAQEVIQGEITGSSFRFNNFTLKEGTNAFTIHAEGPNNTSVETQLTVNCDTIAPAITLTAPATESGITAATSTVLQGTVTETNLDSVRINGTPCSALDMDTGVFSSTVNLTEGPNQLLLRARDKAGNESEVTVTMLRDSMAPRVSITTPAKDALLNSTPITVSGTREADVTEITINGTAAVLADGTFSLENVALDEGENNLAVYAKDNANNVSNTYHRLLLDTTAPTIETVVPVNGAAGVPVDYTIRVEFNEAIDPTTVTSETVYLEPGGNGLYNVKGNSLEFSTGRFPDNATLTLHVTTGVKDLAGHGLTAAYSSTFSTNDTSAPEAPVVNALPDSTSLDQLTLSGSAEKGGHIVVGGGFGAVETDCDANGNFSLQVTLKENQKNQLEITVTDAAKHTSPPAVVYITHENSVFRITDADLSGAVLSVEFTRDVDVLSLSGNCFRVESAAGVVAGTPVLSEDPRVITFQVPPALVSSRLSVMVSTGLKDSEGRSLEYPFTKLFNLEVGSGMGSVQGEVYDDVTGMPLSGVVIRMVNSPEQPAPAVVTYDTGAYSLPVPEGLCIVDISRTGYTSVRRVVNIGPGFSTMLFDARLTPRIGESKVLSGDGGNFSFPVAVGKYVGEKVSLYCPAGAVLEETSIDLTVVSGQSLKGRLPLGWSPLWAIDIKASSASQDMDITANQNSSGNTGGQVQFFQETSTTPVLAEGEAAEGGTLSLKVPNKWPGLQLDNLVLAGWDDESSSWKVAGGLSMSPTSLSADITAAGQYVFLVKDTAGTAPPSASVDAPLPGTAKVEVPQSAGGTLNFSPPEIMAGDSSVVSMSLSAAQGASEIPSGTALQARIRGDYTFIDESEIPDAGRTMDFTLYKHGGETAVIEFNLSAARHIPLETLKEGIIHTRMTRFNEAVPASMINPAVDTAIDGNGASVFIPAGSVSQSVGVTVDKIDAGQLGLSVGDRFEVLGAVEWNVGGALLNHSATLSMDVDETVLSALPADAQILAIQLQTAELGGGWVLKSSCSIAIAKDRIHTGNIVSGVNFPGILSGGKFVFLHAPGDIGYITGQVNYSRQVVTNGTATTETAVANGVLLSTSQHELLGISAESYVQVGFMEAGTLTGRFDGETASVGYDLETRGQVLNLPLDINQATPQVISTVPENQLTDVEPSTSIMLHFSQAIDASTFNATTVEVQEEVGGTFTTLTGEYSLLDGGVKGRFWPEAPFTAGARVSVSLAPGSLKNTNEVAMVGTYGFYFDIKKVEEFTVDAGKLKLVMPENGIAKIEVENDAFGGAESLAVIVNDSVTHNKSLNGISGGFTYEFAAAAGDRIQVMVIYKEDETSKILEVGDFYFVSEDGKRRIFDSRGGEFTIESGESVVFAENCFSGPVNVGLYPVDTAENVDQLAVMPAGFTRLAAVNVDLGGAGVEVPFSIKVPLPEGVTTATENIFVALEMEVAGERKLMVVDEAYVYNGRLWSGELEKGQLAWPGCKTSGTFSFIHNTDN